MIESNKGVMIFHLKKVDTTDIIDYRDDVGADNPDRP